jgi:hypothetical protein
LKKLLAWAVLAAAMPRAATEIIIFRFTVPLPPLKLWKTEKAEVVADYHPDTQGAGPSDGRATCREDNLTVSEGEAIQWVFPTKNGDIESIYTTIPGDLQP